MSRTRSSALALALALAAVATLAACGGDDDDDAATSSSAATTDDTVTDISLVPATQPSVPAGGASSGLSSRRSVNRAFARAVFHFTEEPALVW